MSAPNPQAFPTTSVNPGMSLRDYFAGQALPAIITATSSGNHSPGDCSGNQPLIVRMALDAYLIADAMLDARKESAR